MQTCRHRSDVQRPLQSESFGPVCMTDLQNVLTSLGSRYYVQAQPTWCGRVLYAVWHEQHSSTRPARPARQCMNNTYNEGAVQALSDTCKLPQYSADTTHTLGVPPTAVRHWPRQCQQGDVSSDSLTAAAQAARLRAAGCLSTPALPEKRKLSRSGLA
jgi:hypothetical protein